MRRSQAPTDVGLTDYQTEQARDAIGGDKVSKVDPSAWAAPTGTIARTTFAAYAAPAISDPPTKAEVQAVANALQAHSQRLAALVTDLIAAGVI
ncbi:hypothetical protein [Novosphingobium sediminicola]|uniref:hypothetical protein n=1 Tax=Novosphingobium sediminicola TaxID=563162 RepID=UPI0016124688|nr:hypothetical protein [Novosphingobium sediminicola]